jgi:hypothetical protein
MSQVAACVVAVPRGFNCKLFFWQYSELSAPPDEFLVIGRKIRLCSAIIVQASKKNFSAQIIPDEYFVIKLGILLAFCFRQRLWQPPP